MSSIAFELLFHLEIGYLEDQESQFLQKGNVNNVSPRMKGKDCFPFSFHKNFARRKQI